MLFRDLRGLLGATAVLGLLIVSASSGALAEPRLFGVNPFQNVSNNGLGGFGLFELDYNTGATLAGTLITLPGFTVGGANGITQDPTTGAIYAILKVNGVNGRVLATIDVETGVAASVGNLGDKFSSIAFRDDGQLFGTTGNGATVSETLFRINKETAATTLVMALGNGADGEVLAFNPNDRNFYHWSGNGTVVMERFPAYPPHNITPLFSGGVNGEIFGAVWDPGRNAFLVTNINSKIQTVTIGGVFSAPFGSQAEDTRGLLLLTPRSVKAPALNHLTTTILLGLLLIGGAYRLRNSPRPA